MTATDHRQRRNAGRRSDRQPAKVDLAGCDAGAEAGQTGLRTVAGWSVRAGANVLGHSTAKLTLDTYGHLMGTDVGKAALKRVDRAFGDPTGTQPNGDSGENSGSDDTNGL